MGRRIEHYLKDERLRIFNEFSELLNSEIKSLQFTDTPNTAKTNSQKAANFNYARALTVLLVSIFAIFIIYIFNLNSYTTELESEIMELQLIINELKK